MSEVVLVGYDSSAACERALDFAADRVTERAGRVVIAHVLEWSPYSFLTQAEIEERHARRKQEMQRAEQAILLPAKAKLAEAGLNVSSEMRFGNVADTLVTLAKTEGVTQICVGRGGQSSLGARIFGSVAGRLVQIAPVPCTIVP